METKKSLIILIGFMGSGKSTFGKKLAHSMGFTFYDLDELLVKKLGHSIPVYFDKYGEEAFRLEEKNILQELTKLQNAVVATGGGTPCFYDNMEQLNRIGITIYLKLTPKALQSRLNQANVEKRPLLKEFTGDTLFEFISSKLIEREVYYNQATLTVDQLNTSPKKVIDYIKNIK